MASDLSPISDQVFGRQVRAAEARSKRIREEQPRAVSVRYDGRSGRIEVDLSNGCFFAFPAELGEGLRGADSSALAEVEVSAAGYGLRWPRLDVDLTLGNLMKGVFGTRRWMSELGRLGGQARTEAKSRAARENGRKGGRPRTSGP